MTAIINLYMARAITASRPAPMSITTQLPPPTWYPRMAPTTKPTNVKKSLVPEPELVVVDFWVFLGMDLFFDYGAVVAGIL